MIEELKCYVRIGDMNYFLPFSRNFVMTMALRENTQVIILLNRMESLKLKHNCGRNGKKPA